MTGIMEQEQKPEARSQKQEARSSPTGAARSLLASDGRQLALLASCF
jgi:hypothetical protein